MATVFPRLIERLRQVPRIPPRPLARPVVRPHPVTARPRILPPPPQPFGIISRAVTREPVAAGDLEPRTVGAVASTVRAQVTAPAPQEPVAMRLTTCSTCGGPMETPATSTPAVSASLQPAPELGATAEPGATPGAMPPSEAPAAPGQPKPGGGVPVVLLVLGGALTVAAVAWLFMRRRKGDT